MASKSNYKTERGKRAQTFLLLDSLPFQTF